MIISVKLKFDKFLCDTGKAILISINRNEFWIPNSLCRMLHYNNKLKGSVVIPAFFYEKMGFEATENIAYEIRTHHTPKKINKKINYDDSLIR